MKHSMRKLQGSVVASLLLCVSCNPFHDESKRPASAKPTTLETPQKGTQGSPIRVPPVEAVVFIDADAVLVFRGYLRGVADEETVNRDRVPLITQDGGASWNEVSSRTTNFRSVSFVSVSRGWLVNEDSELWATTDGGVSWALVSRISDSEGALGYSPQVKFADELNGWVLDWQSPSIWHTEDGGKTWLRHVFPGPAFKFFLQRNVSWVVSQSQDGRTNVIQKSSNAGKSWEQIEVPHTIADPLGDMEIEDLFVVNEQSGWLSNFRGIYRTDDGGTNWREQRLPGKVRIAKFFFVDDHNGWAVGWKQLRKAADEAEAVLLHTTDGGDAWQQVNVGEKQTSFEQVFFKDLQNGWLVARETREDFSIDSASMYRTRDGGKSWKKVLSVKSPYPPG